MNLSRVARFRVLKKLLAKSPKSRWKYLCQTYGIRDSLVKRESSDDHLIA